MNDMTEEQQAEQLRRWWKENGRSVIIGLVILLIGVTPGSSGIAEIAFGGFFREFITIAGVGGTLALL